jgi:hypothetical protein
MPQPIFILGKHRSGTTWLANQLCQHSCITGITHTRFSGIHESAYFSLVDGRYGDLSVKSNFIEFVEVVSASDYFRLAGATKEYLYSLYPTTYEDVFRIVMDNYAEKQKAQYWLEKTPPHALIVDKLARIYPDARFISIIRNAEAVVASTIARSKFSGVNIFLRQYIIISTILSWTLYNKVLESFEKQSDRIISIRYEELKSDLPTTLQTVCAFLGLHFETGMCEQIFVPNTSFQNSKREHALTNVEKILVRVLHRIFAFIPVLMLKFLHRMKNNTKKRPIFPSWFFLMHPFYKNEKNLTK